MDKHFIDKHLLAELSRKRDILMNRVSDETGLRSSLFSAAHLDASYHSKITEPDKALRVQRVGRRKDFRETRGHLEEARDYARDHFKGKLTKDVLLDVASIIEPNVSHSYRNEMVIISGYRDIPTNPLKIEEEMRALIGLMNDDSLDPVERATLFHLHCLRIHPFIDGNGRTSRFIQNMLLAQNNYAPAALYPAERTFYNDLMHSARSSFRERGADGIRAPELMVIPPPIRSAEHDFLHYLATRVNVGMDNLIGDYEEIPHYEIRLGGFNNPGQVVRVKKILASYFRQLGLPAHVSITNLKSGRLEIRAKTSDNALSRLLNRKTDLRYRITEYS